MMSREVERRHISPPATVSGIRPVPDTGDGEALEIIVQRRRDKRAPLKLLRKTVEDTWVRAEDPGD